MSQGIFGLIDFNGRISDPETLTLSMSSFLRKNGARESGIEDLQKRGKRKLLLVEAR